jgi:undecaprenyl-diphosphatase
MSVWLIAVILGIVEGITEFLPVSSTGHLLIAEHLMKIHQSDLYNIVIQCGAVIAVIPLFPERMRQLLRWREDAQARDFIAKVLVAFAITGAGGLILDKKGFKLPEEVLPIALALLIGGVLFLAVEVWLAGRKTNDNITWTIVAAVGIGQLLAAIFPGTSRSGSTILLMLALGMGRAAATEFSFLVGIPTMLAAGGWKIFKAFHHPPPDATPENWGALALCTIVSAIVSFIAVKWLLGFVRTHTFKGFGWYRVAIGLVMLIFFLH